MSRPTSAPASANGTGKLRVTVIESLVREHVDEAVCLHALRTLLTRAPHSGLHDLSRFDERLDAHRDGLSVAGEHGWRFCQEALETSSRAAVFVAAVRAIEEKQQPRIDACLALAGAVPELRGGVSAAFGWLSQPKLRGIVTSLLGSPEPFKRLIGVSACALHRVDPGLVGRELLRDASEVVLARALRTAGEIGCLHAHAECMARIGHEDADCQFWAARSSVLLGSRGAALTYLRQTALEGPNRWRGLHLALQALSVAAAHEVLRQLRESNEIEWVIRGSGIVGDPGYVHWLLHLMTSEKTARQAGEAFSLITGVDLAESRLEGETPKSGLSGPTEDPEDPHVDMDPDRGLPWPDPDRVQKWWAANSHRFQPGQRYFMGAPVTREHCIDVLKNGYQRQRILAAHYLCLLNPGTPLFNTSAPAWRQQRLLSQM